MELKARAAAEELQAKENVVRSQATAITDLVSCLTGSGNLYSEYRQQNECETAKKEKVQVYV